MAFKERNRRAADNDAVEAFAAGAEPGPTPEPEPRPLTLEERTKQRAAGKKYIMYSVRGTEAQDALVKRASKEEGISQNEVYLKYVLGPLEEKYGKDVPTKRSEL